MHAVLAQGLNQLICLGRYLAILIKQRAVHIGCNQFKHRKAPFGLVGIERVSDSNVPKGSSNKTPQS